MTIFFLFFAIGQQQEREEKENIWWKYEREKY